MAYFFLPLIGTFEFSLRMRRGEYSFDAYRVVLADPRFQATFGYSVVMALATILVGVLLVVPTAYWVRLRCRAAAGRRVHHAAAAGHPGHRHRLRLYPALQLLLAPAADRHRAAGTNFLLIFGYATLALPYMYRAVDTGLRAIDVRTLTEAAESLGAGWPTIMFAVILPNVLVAVLSGAFLTFAIVIGEFTMASLLNRPAFGPYLQLIGANRAYEPAALAVIAFAITWACMGLIQLVARLRRSTARRVDRMSKTDAFLEIEQICRSPSAQPTVVQRFQPRHRAGRVRLVPRPVAAAARPRRCAWSRGSRPRARAASASTAGT